ncbi:MAG: DUF349 domain-containing protein [Paludibacteraceae bacterium]|nr:DUF349 domain-containing protein [Paludibacteraceae bacterium]MBP5742565.1 DUF349 domain-containing protein [Paludibacteraceae bacterium]
MEALEKNNTEKNISLQEIIEKMRTIAESDCDDSNKNEATSLKKLFYYTLNNCRFNQTADEDKSEDYNALEEEFKGLFNIFHEKRNAFIAAKQKKEADNLEKRKNIIKKIEAYIENPEKIHEAFNDFKALQQEWKEIGEVPANEKSEVFKKYNSLNEQFYDLLKMNIELREYDFKKNLEIKTELCEKAEALDKEENVISAFNSLQALHEQWTQTGPVAKDVREQIWLRFKEASTVINKKHNAFFEERKQKEQEALKEKEEICQKAEAIDLSNINTAADWNKITDDVKKIQQEWKNAGYTPAKISESIYDRYRNACSKFFEARNAFFGKINEERKANKKLKMELIKKANELKNSNDWRNTANAIANLQKEWKTIGPVPTQSNQSMWKEFNAACNEFFQRRQAAYDKNKNEEIENLKKKQAVIEQIENFKDLGDAKDNAKAVKKLIAEFNAIGRVPYDEKDNVYESYHKAVDKVFDALKLDDLFRPADVNKLRSIAEKLKNEILTAENNFMFLSPANSKKQNPLLDEMKKNIEKMKKDLEKTLKRIEINEKKA